MLDSDIKSILGEKYNDSFFEQGSSLSNVLHKEGILVFDSFISPIGLIKLQNEAAELKPNSFKSSSEYNVYVSDYDDKFPSESPRNRIMSTTKKCIPNDLIPKDSILQRLYDSSFLKSFFCDLLGKDNQEKSGLMMGRSKACDLPVNEQLASRQHVKIELRRDKFFVIDQSTNGTHIKIDGGDESFLRREEMPINANGKISLGKAFKDSPSEIVTFTLKST